MLKSLDVYNAVLSADTSTLVYAFRVVSSVLNDITKGCPFSGAEAIARLAQFTT